MNTRDPVKSPRGPDRPMVSRRLILHKITSCSTRNGCTLYIGLKRPNCGRCCRHSVARAEASLAQGSLEAWAWRSLRQLPGPGGGRHDHAMHGGWIRSCETNIGASGATFPRNRTSASRSRAAAGSPALAAFACTVAGRRRRGAAGTRRVGRRRKSARRRRRNVGRTALLREFLAAHGRATQTASVAY